RLVIVLLIIFIYLPILSLRPPRSSPFSLHDALPIFLQFHSHVKAGLSAQCREQRIWALLADDVAHEGQGNRLNINFIGNFNVRQDRKSTRLNSSHVKISYAVFCLKKKT